jgi:hypothetical protein
LRLSIVAIVFALLAAVGVNPAPAQAATPVQAKVVIIVGPVEGTTSSYRSAADLAYAEAIKYTSDVTRLYSPNATWSKVKAATVGASVVIYLGHGNGWPSPYAYDAQYTTKDGFGLNATAGAGDSNNKYYGEPSIADLDLAPDAIVILNRLCYASGNSEPGASEPTRTVARQRVDNFASAFLKAGASAVIADGHGNAAPYVRSLFTTSGSLVDLWRGVGSNGNELSWASARTAGATAYTDTDTATTGYYRSLVTRPGKTSADVLTGMGTRTVSTLATTRAASDIASSKFRADIEWLYASGLTTGCSSTKFCPNGVVTRGQMASFLARALTLPSSTKDYFRDDSNVSHEANINRIAKAALTTGCGTYRYCPYGVVTRGQMASFLARALDLPASSKDYFSDDGNVSHEANINRIAKAGLTSGCGGGRFCPTSVLTRGQMAAFLHRAFGE